MRLTIKAFVGAVARTVKLEEPIYEFGALQVAGQEGFADLRPLFPGKSYVGCDMREGVGVDKVLDLHHIDLPDATAGTVICLDTLEHVEFPHQALKELHRILKPHGVVVISSVMKFPIHDHPYDYWRFTPEGFASLLRPFAHAFVGYAGDQDLPHTVVGLGFKGEQPDLSQFQKEYAAWQAAQVPKVAPVPRLKRWVKLCTPPLVWNVAKRVLKPAVPDAGEPDTVT